MGHEDNFQLAHQTAGGSIHHCFQLGIALVEMQLHKMDEEDQEDTAQGNCRDSLAGEAHQSGEGARRSVVLVEVRSRHKEDADHSTVVVGKIPPFLTAEDLEHSIASPGEISGALTGKALEMNNIPTAELDAEVHEAERRLLDLQRDEMSIPGVLRVSLDDQG